MSKLHPHKNHKLNGVTIEVLCIRHGEQVRAFWESVGIHSNYTFQNIGSCYGIIHGVFRQWDDDVTVQHSGGIVLTIQQATEMWHLNRLPKGIKTSITTTFR